MLPEVAYDHAGVHNLQLLLLPQLVLGQWADQVRQKARVEDACTYHSVLKYTKVPTTVGIVLTVLHYLHTVARC